MVTDDQLKEFFNEDYYRIGFAENPPRDLLYHYMSCGWREGRDPCPDFSTRFYLETYPDVLASNENPFRHWVRVGRFEGRVARPPGSPPPAIAVNDAAPELATVADDVAIPSEVAAEFDADYYLSSFDKDARPSDPLKHYLQKGWLEGRDPSPAFSVHHYLAMHPDVSRAGVEPFSHYVTQGRKEKRAVVGRSANASRLYRAHNFATMPGPHFEEVDPTLGEKATPRARVLAYYLPQFHATRENNRFWGNGFTEWSNVSKGLPKFEGHLQPKLPRDLGYYDLSCDTAIRAQIEMAKTAGLDGFCIYYYWFNGERVLDRPLEILLSNASLDFPFCLIWANENWTRTWDGQDNEVLLQQSYNFDDDSALLADWARHFSDPRYIRVAGRPLFILYRPGKIPDAEARIAEWRSRLQIEYNLNPVILMAQGFGDEDPRKFGIDGAIEFPPHKLGADLDDISADLDMLDPAYAGHIRAWDDLVDRSLAVRDVPYPLVRTAVPQWDNEARRPGRGLVFHGATPRKFQDWMVRLIAWARANPLLGEPIVCVNAWNEWAEGAVLEPDTHHGGAYLNALSRAIFGRQTRHNATSKVLIVGHDAERNGAQVLVLKIGKLLKRMFGVDVAFLLGAAGPLTEAFRSLGPVEIAPPDRDTAGLASAVDRLVRKGYSAAITNTVATGWMVPELARRGMHIVGLIHELPSVIRTGGFSEDARQIARLANRIVFPAEVVRSGFVEIAGRPQAATELMPQGLHDGRLLYAQPDKASHRADLGLPQDAKVVISVAYGDLRKGPDRFVATALSCLKSIDNVYFVWIGPLAADVSNWVFKDIDPRRVGNRVRHVEYTDNLVPWYIAADIFFLPSREDPFPSVVLEALAAGLPVVGYANTGGCDTLIAHHGVLIDTADPTATAAAIKGLLDQSEPKKARSAAARREEVRRNYDFSDYCFHLLKRLNPNLLEVSVVAPLFNYEHYASERISTILHQSMPLREIIVLDDASSDNSLGVALDTASASGREVRSHRNEVNAGTPFRQWRRGGEMARGDYVWIAEADDTCHPDFLALVTAAMRRSGAAIGFCDSWQMGADDERLSESYRPYMSEFTPGAFDTDFDMAGHDFIDRFLAVRNVILNVSGAVLRRDALLEAMQRIGESLDDMRVAGDWCIYIEICAAGGSVAFVSRALNGHRRHQTSVTHALDPEQHFGEIASMQRLAAERVSLSESTRRRQKDYLAEVGSILGVNA